MNAGEYQGLSSAWIATDMPADMPPLPPCPLPVCRLAAAASLNLADLYPFTALITNKEVPLCSGALVAPQLVLTTAACARSGPNFVYLGYFNFFLDEFR